MKIYTLFRICSLIFLTGVVSSLSNAKEINYSKDFDEAYDGSPYVVVYEPYDAINVAPYQLEALKVLLMYCNKMGLPAKLSSAYSELGYREFSRSILHLLISEELSNNNYYCVLKAVAYNKDAQSVQVLKDIYRLAPKIRFGHSQDNYLDGREYHDYVKFYRGILLLRSDVLLAMEMHGSPELKAFVAKVAARDTPLGKQAKNHRRQATMRAERDSLNASSSERSFINAYINSSAFLCVLDVIAGSCLNYICC